MTKNNVKYGLIGMVAVSGIVWFTFLQKSETRIPGTSPDSENQGGRALSGGTKAASTGRPAGGNRSVDEETEKKISAKYEDLKKELQVLEHRLPAGTLKEFRASQLRLARTFVLNNPAYKAELHKLFDEVLAYKKSYPWMKGEKANALLSTLDNPSPQTHVAAALLADDSSMLKDALAKFPDDGDVLLAALIHNGKFLTDSEGLKKLEGLQPESPWPKILKAIAEMKGGDIASAAADLNRALSQEISPFERTYNDAWARMSDLFKAENTGDQPWPSTAEGLFSKSSRDLLADIVLGAANFYKQHQNDPGALAFISAALALSERVSETQNLVGQRVALMNQLDILTAMGPEAAQPYLSLPYQEYVDSIRDRRAELHDLINTVEDFKQTLTPEDRANFKSIEAVNGDLAAYEAMRQK